MKTIILLAACVICAVQALPVDNSQTTVLKYENDNIGIGGYKFAYETSDGVSRQEEAELKNAGTDTAALSVKGTVTWVAPDGQSYTLNYIADENGYQPEAAHLPKA